jgi:hypothetical protein
MGPPEMVARQRAGTLDLAETGASENSASQAGTSQAGASQTGTAAEVAARRLAAQLLSGEPARTAVDVAGRLLAVQGQDPRGARLAVRARTTGLTAADVDRALSEDRSLVITWLNRGTLHLIRSEDYWLLHGLTVRAGLHSRCRAILARSGVSDSAADKGVAAVQRALAADGPLTREQLHDVIAAADLPAGAGVPLHVLMLASLRGICVRGPMIGARHAYVLVRDWLGAAPPAQDPDAAVAELAARYLAGHGPASERDLAKWAGLPVGAVRRGLAAIAPRLRSRSDGLAELRGAQQQPPPLPAPRLLGAYDPVLLGWAAREPILGPHRQIVSANGLFRPFLLVEGRAAGTWAWSAGRVTLDRFAEFPADVEASLAAEARDVQRFLAGEPEPEAG